MKTKSKELHQKTKTLTPNNIQQNNCIKKTKQLHQKTFENWRKS